MASKPISVQILVDKEHNKVIFAESNKDFVDVLFSFLTLPMGTITRVIQSQDVLQCIKNLNHSVNNLEAAHFQTAACKEMLVCTRNSCEDDCRRLKINIDDTQRATYYYVCSSWSQNHNPQGLSSFAGIRCSCGSKMDSFMGSVKIDTNSGSDDGVFVKGAATFIITDDLKVMPMTTGTTIYLLNSMGIKNIELLEKRSISIGRDEVLSLLKHSFFSNNALTDVFLGARETKCNLNVKVEESNSIPYLAASNFQKMFFKVIVRKSNNEVIYVEAREKFVSFLFRILTFPLGAIINLIKGGTSLGHISITNVYNSVQTLYNGNTEIISWLHSEMLLHPKVALQYGCKDNILGILEVAHPTYFYNNKRKTNRLSGYNVTSLTIDKPDSSVDIKSKESYSKNIYLVDPKSPYPGEGTVQGYLKGPATYIVTDDLVVKRMASTSTIDYLQQRKISISDIEEKEVSIGQEEALGILESVLTSDKVLTSIIKRFINKKIPKQEKI